MCNTGETQLRHAGFQPTSRYSTGLYYPTAQLPTSVYLLVLSCLSVTQEPIKIPKLRIITRSNYLALQFASTGTFQRAGGVPRRRSPSWAPVGILSAGSYTVMAAVTLRLKLALKNTLWQLQVWANFWGSTTTVFPSSNPIKNSDI